MNVKKKDLLNTIDSNYIIKKLAVRIVLLINYDNFNI
jgi:hypothetical protein